MNSKYFSRVRKCFTCLLLVSFITTNSSYSEITPTVQTHQASSLSPHLIYGAEYIHYDEGNTSIRELMKLKSVLLYVAKYFFENDGTAEKVVLELKNKFRNEPYFLKNIDLTDTPPFRENDKVYLRVNILDEVHVVEITDLKEAAKDSPRHRYSLKTYLKEKARDTKGVMATRETNSIINELIKDSTVEIVEIRLESGKLKAFRIKYNENYIPGKTKIEEYEDYEISIEDILNVQQQEAVREWINKNPVDGELVKFRIVLDSVALLWQDNMDRSHISHAGHRDKMIYTGEYFFKYVFTKGNEEFRREVLDEDELRHIKDKYFFHDGNFDAYKLLLTKVGKVLEELNRQHSKWSRPMVMFSVLTSEIDRIMDEIKTAKAKRISAIHLDFLDGIFTPGSQPFDCSPQIKIFSTIDIPMEVHLMVKSPTIEIISKMKRAGLTPGRDRIGVHYESFSSVEELKRFIKSVNEFDFGCNLVMNNETDIDELDNVKHLLGVEITRIVLMGIVPGEVGRPFLPGTIPKISQLRKYLYERDIKDIDIEIDGGINEEVLGHILGSAIDAFVTRTWIKKEASMETAMEKICNVYQGFKIERDILSEMFKERGLFINQFVVDAVTDFCGGSDIYTEHDIKEYFNKIPGVNEVIIRSERVVDVNYRGKLIRFHNKGVVPVEFLGLEDRTYYKNAVIKVYGGEYTLDPQGEYILGISGTWHDSTVVLMKNGQIISMLEEERMSRSKHDDSLFPMNSIQKVMKDAKITWDDIKDVTFGWNFNRYVVTPHSKSPDKEFFQQMDREYAALKGIGVDGVKRRNVPEKNRQRFDVAKVVEFINEMKGFYGSEHVPRVTFVRHHLAHAASAYDASGFKGSVLTVVLDGYGDNETGSVWLGKDGNLEEIAHFDLPNSVGWIWSTITEYLGFMPTFEEGQVMGLAPYGEPRD
ncbi:MAG: carbamoyltransferase N-terminal domain-containing protein, partial [Candidatus Omnitrophica bacterium]|nr:carbamoyltransferase N-terminal domain-containing protein [Candidatus Omnitrophota bacterium]